MAGVTEEQARHKAEHVIPNLTDEELPHYAPEARKYRELHPLEIEALARRAK